MKLFPIQSFLFLFLFLTATQCFAEQREITASWQGNDIQGVEKYEIYYSYSSDMSGKIFACSTTDPAATSLSCKNLTFTQEPVYFRLEITFSDEVIVTNTKEVHRVVVAPVIQLISLIPE